jgi:hypothetical protein
MFRTFVIAALLLAFEIAAAAPPGPTSPKAKPASRTEAYLAAALAESADNPTKLTLFLAQIPKGGDLHHHLTGAVYAESYIQYAAEDGDCFDATFTIVPPPCDPAKGTSPASRGITDYLFRPKLLAGSGRREHPRALLPNVFQVRSRDERTLARDVCRGRRSRGDAA